MDWNDVRHFLALARLGSVRAAGASLGVSHSTVARRVEALEAQLSARLFDRSRDGYTLTDAGRQMLPGAERIEREMCSLERGLVGQDERLSGPVALTLCDPFVADLVLRGITAFCDAHPAIEIAINTDSRPFDLAKREADIAVRALGVGVAPPEHLIGRKLVPLVLGNYVAVAHAARRDPDAPGSEPRWAAYDDRAVQEQMAEGSSYPQVPCWGAFPSLHLMARAVEVGLGVGMLPTYVGDPHPALRRLAQPDLRHMADLWLLSHVDLRENARFRAVRGEVTRILSEHLPLFRGQGGAALHRTVPSLGQPAGPDPR